MERGAALISTGEGISSSPLAWHLDAALPRLLFHIGPVTFLAAIWLILEAKEVWASTNASKSRHECRSMRMTIAGN
jgi:hypothetical protein